MSILIKGMEMPKDRAVIEIHPVGGYACTRYGFVIGRVIELPPHGDLIDVETLLEGILSIVFQRSDNPSNVTINANTLLKLVDSLPTIIPAEEK